MTSELTRQINDVSSLAICKNNSYLTSALQIELAPVTSNKGIALFSPDKNADKLRKSKHFAVKITHVPAQLNRLTDINS